MRTTFSPPSSLAWLACCVLVWTPSLRAPCLQAQETAAALDEEWYTITIDGSLAGTMHERKQARDAGGYVVELRQTLKLKRGQVELEIRTFQSLEEDAKGGFVGFRAERDMSKQKMYAEGKVRGEVLHVTEWTPGSPKRTREVPVPKSARGAEFTRRLLRERVQALKRGESVQRIVETVAFVPDANVFGKQTVTLGELENVSIQGRVEKLRRIRVAQEVLPGFVMTQWVNDAGRERKFAIPLAGMLMEVVRCDRETALQAEVSAPPEVFLSTSVRVAKRLPRNCRSATYRLTFEGASEREIVPLVTGLERPGQRIITRDGNRVTLAVTQVERGDEKDSATRPTKEAQEPNTYVQSDDPAVIAVARKVSGLGKDDWETAKKLERWVFDEIAEKNLKTAFATAKEVLSTKEGDCTEHAVLLAALARATKIPARVVAGLVYHKGAFVGHMWSEVHVGTWRPLDATVGRGVVGADHIALASSSLGSSSLVELSVRLNAVIGQVKIEVLDAE